MSRLRENTADFQKAQAKFSLALDPAQDDVLLMAQEILDAWEISDYRLRLLVKAGELRRVRRPNYQPYYPLSAVESILGPPKHDPKPRYPSVVERQDDERLAA